MTSPALVTLATDGFWLDHVPPVPGDSVVVDPTQIVCGPVMETAEPDTTVIMPDESEVHPVNEFVKIKRAVPGVRPVTRPALVIPATAGFVLVQVPPAEGKNCVVLPRQI